ncbi:MAG: carboxyltransferase domain-containing protein, partial [Burkholderia vietnamiensis]|nr:carboxyltransferase domain-containing protein [Burkholderia vietnamiensis]
MTQPRIYPLGDAALVCEMPAPATLDCQRRVWAVAEAARAWPDVIDVVPGMNNLTIVFDALASTAESLTPALRDAWDSADVAPVPGRDVEIPVEYGGAAGPDLAAVAAHTGLSADEVVARHAGGEYVVFFVGFQPGFAYLGGLD